MATKKEWGNATWYLFHTLSFKMKDEYFAELKNDFLIQILYFSCSNFFLNPKNKVTNERN